MSVVSSRPRVRGVSLMASAAFVTGAGLAAVLLRSAGAAARAAYREGSKARQALRECAKLDSVAEIEARQRRASTRRSGALVGLPPSDALKVETALLLEDYAVADVPGLAPRIGALRRSRSLPETQEASRTLLEAVRAQHHELLVRNLTDACMRASRNAGFETVKTRRRADQIRVIATNRSGQALVTEIDVAYGRHLSLATEVVGIRDGSCHGVLDRFDEALEAEGVIAGPRRRSPTGGVCQLETARDALRELCRAPRKAPAPKSTWPAAMEREAGKPTPKHRPSRTRVVRGRRS